MKISWIPEASAQQTCDTKIIMLQARSFVTNCLLHGKAQHFSCSTPWEWGLIKAFLYCSLPLLQCSARSCKRYLSYCLNHQNNSCFLQIPNSKNSASKEQDLGIPRMLCSKVDGIFLPLIRRVTDNQWEWREWESTLPRREVTQSYVVSPKSIAIKAALNWRGHELAR